VTVEQPGLGIVAECGPGVGNGHVGRCLALAQAWARGGGSVSLLAVGSLDAGWVARYRATGTEVSIVDPDEAVAHVAAGIDAEAWVVDGYGLPADLPTALRTGVGARVAVVDDGGRRGRYDADWVVDQNLGADAGRYDDRTDGCQLLLGTRYALLRTDVTAGRPSAPPDRTGAPRRLLTALGGSPPAGARSLFGAVARDERLRDLGIEVVELAGAPDVGAVLAGADLALTAAGSTVWELCAWGVPSVAVVIADNQRVVARRAGAAGLVVDAGDLEQVGPEDLVAAIVALAADGSRRQALAGRAWAAIDGLGARRTATALRGSLLRVRPAGPDDEDLLGAWANDPVLRQHSFSPEPIPASDHQRWFAARLADDRTLIRIVERADGTPLGQVRFEVQGPVAVIDYSIAAVHRGRGWGGPLLDAAVRASWAALASRGVEVVEARVRPENVASIRSIEAADFTVGADGSSDRWTWHTYTRSRHG
jgi:spore coat polysaccharide biosynthesis predicted glycosyltransferase SpsG/RimJ/RimL family protein N-acetyltransferase